MLEKIKTHKDWEDKTKEETFSPKPFNETAEHRQGND